LLNKSIDLQSVRAIRYAIYLPLTPILAILDDKLKANTI
jgi:hypothetical protein